MSEEIKRFEVTTECRVIIYAPDGETASSRALAALGFRKRSGSDEEMPAKVVGVTELPALLAEKRTPIVDRAPGRETRK